MRNPEQTRIKLVATATQLLLTKGREGLRVDEVAATACVNKRMIYHYFKNKEGLYQAVLQSQVELLVDSADVLSPNAKAFLAEHFSLRANKPDARKTLKPESDASSGVEGSAAITQQRLQDAGLIVLRALLGQRHFTVRLNSADWASLAQGLMALALPQLSAVDEAAVIAKTLGKRPLTEKPRYTLRAQHRFSE